MLNTHKKNDVGYHPLPLLVTTGEPAGIGMDIILKLASQGKLAQLNRQVIVLADNRALTQRCNAMFSSSNSQGDSNEDDGNQRPKAPKWQVIAKIEHQNDHQSTVQRKERLQQRLTQLVDNFEKILEQKNSIVSDSIILSTRKTNTLLPSFSIIDIATANIVTPGQLNVGNAQMVMTQLQLAHDLANSGQVAAIVTGPLHKSVLINAGLTLADGSMFTGHTEFFMQQSHCDKVVMMLANSAMRVGLVTTHLPLREVADAITTANVRQTVQIVVNDLSDKFGLVQPKILVCGLNPHAGEDGHLGREEIEIINPVLKEFQAQGVDISNAMPADTLFTSRHLEDCDAVIAMFHDQGLPVLKSHGFGDTVNLTLGLPYIRTSVDHGTALDLAGKAIGNSEVSASSLWQALTMADNMANSITS